MNVDTNSDEEIFSRDRLLSLTQHSVDELSSEIKNTFPSCQTLSQWAIVLVQNVLFRDPLSR